MATAKKPVAAKKLIIKKPAATPVKKPAAKKTVATTERKPLKPTRKTAAPALAAPAVPAAAPATPPQTIPYHYVVLFELENEQRKTADGVLTIDRPITDHKAYEGVKAQLVKHFNLEAEVKAVTITTLHRLDSMQLLLEPAKA